MEIYSQNEFLSKTDEQCQRISVFFSNLCVIFLYKGNSVCKCHKEIAMGQEQIEAKSGCTTYRIHLFFIDFFFQLLTMTVLGDGP